MFCCRSFLPCLAVALFSAVGWSRAEEVAVEFLPPPLDDAKLSLGVYDAKGRLVRTLRAEADEKQFKVALNGYIAGWDGRDDAGKTVGKGVYRVRGFAVGKMSIEGLAFHGNDWVGDEEGPRVRWVSGLRLAGDGRLLLSTELQDGAAALVVADGVKGSLAPVAASDGGQALFLAARKAERKIRLPDGADAGAAVRLGVEPERELVLHDGKVGVVRGGAVVDFAWPGVEWVADAAWSRGGGVWVVDWGVDGVELKEFSLAGELQRRMGFPADQPRPVAVAAAADAERVFLLEATTATCRVRALELVETAAQNGGEAVSSWKELFSRSVTPCDDLKSAQGIIAWVAAPKFRVRLVNNPLERDEPGSAEVTVAADARGAVLRTVDGLTLARLTDNTGLAWAQLVNGGSGKLPHFLQSDGAVVEEFRLHRLAEMMAFDAGDYHWPPQVSELEDKATPRAEP